MPTPIQLPDKPSELIRLALSDLRKCEADPKYNVDMSDWHCPEFGTCHVCLAGAVMAKTEQCPIDVDTVPCNTANGSKYVALDNFRCGFIDSAMINLGLDTPKELAGIYCVTPYAEDKAQFHLDMESLAALLQNHGL
jgi:hypothetical protein